MIYYFKIRFSDLFNAGKWEQYKYMIDSIGDPDFCRLYQKLPEYILSSRADNTRRKYQYTFNSWCKWANTHYVTSLPASHLHVALYLINLSVSKFS